MARQASAERTRAPSSWSHAGNEAGYAPLSAFLHEPSDDVLEQEAEEWNRQIQALDERRNSYERLLRGMVQRNDRRRPRRDR